MFNALQALLYMGRELHRGKQGEGGREGRGRGEREGARGEYKSPDGDLLSTYGQ
jgi:hypothetical protein